MTNAQQEALKLNPPQPKECKEFKHWEYVGGVIKGKLVVKERPNVT